MQTIFKPIPSGCLKGDKSIEIFGDRKTKEVYFLHDGKTQDFSQMPQKFKRMLLKKLLGDPIAREQLGHLGYTEALKRFAFCHYGSLDNVPDICSNGHLGPTDNFRCSDNCMCMSWKSKQIHTQDGQSITKKQLQIIDHIRKGFPDKLIAHKLGIAISTLDNHKTAIMKKLHAFSRVDIITKSINQNIIQ